MTSKQIKLAPGPNESNLAVVDDKVVIKIHLPYTDDSVTIQVNPSVQKYVEKPATNVRQMMITTPTSETTTLSLDLKTNRRKQFSSGEGTEYEIELLKISKQGHLRTFEFNVSWDEPKP